MLGEENKSPIQRYLEKQITLATASRKTDFLCNSINEDNISPMY